MSVVRFQDAGTEAYVLAAMLKSPQHWAEVPEAWFHGEVERQTYIELKKCLAPPIGTFPSVDIVVDKASSPEVKLFVKEIASIDIDVRTLIVKRQDLYSMYATRKLDQVIRELLVRLASKSENVDPYDFVQQEVHRKFVQLTIEQSNLLSFYVLAEVTRIITVPDELKGKLDIESMGGLSEEISMRLQMMLDKRSKVIRPISNIMKEISSTQDTLVQNIK